MIYIIATSYLDETVSPTIDQVYTIKPSSTICNYLSNMATTGQSSTLSATGNNDILLEIAKNVKTLLQANEDHNKRIDKHEAAISQLEADMQIIKNQLLNPFNSVRNTGATYANVVNSTPATAQPSKKRTLELTNSPPSSTSSYNTNNPNIRRKTVIIGSGQNMQVEAAPRVFTVYLGNLKLTEDWQKVAQLLHSNKLKFTNLKQLKTVHNNFLSYSFDIPYEQKDLIYDSKIWPINTVVNKFIRPRATQSGALHPQPSSNTQAATKACVPNNTQTSNNTTINLQASNSQTSTRSQSSPNARVSSAPTTTKARTNAHVQASPNIQATRNITKNNCEKSSTNNKPVKTDDDSQMDTNVTQNE